MPRVIELPSPEEIEAASPTERVRLLKQAELALALQSPGYYAEYVTRNDAPNFRFQRYRHIQALDRMLVKLINHELVHPVTRVPISKAMVEMPPRHGKSFMCSEFTPAWYLKTHPDHRVIEATYESTFAEEWGYKVRKRIEGNPEFGIRLDPASRAKGNWDIEGRYGGMKCAGAGGPITGKGFQLGIIDDPHKNAEEALSDVIRTKSHDWYESTWRTRREPNAVELLIQTRWHEDDLGGYLLNNYADEWYELKFPALALEEDPLGRKPGEALCPERYSREDLLGIQGDPSEPGWVWDALYQQNPVTKGSGIFQSDGFRYYRISEDLRNYYLTHDNGAVELIRVRDCSRFSTIDTADSEKKWADWTVVMVWDLTPHGDLILVDMFRKRIESSAHEELILRFLRGVYQRTGRQTGWLGVESKTFGSTLIQNLRRRGIACRELKAENDKVSRAVTAGALYDGKRIWHPKGAKFNPELEKELLAFPKGKHDDQVDCVSYAAHHANMIALASGDGGRERKFTDSRFVGTSDDPVLEKLEAHFERKEKRTRSLKKGIGIWRA